MITKVQLNHSNENPFYGLKNCLKLFQCSTDAISEVLLNKCYNEVENDEENRKMFFSLLFSIGDITARQHNIFEGIQKDSGGNANREGFYTIFMWLRENHKEQFYKFMYAGLFNEYTCFDLLFKSRVKTKDGVVLKVYNALADPEYRFKLAEYLYSIIKGTNTYNKFLVAKFLTLPRLTKRCGHKKMLDSTKTNMEHKASLLVELSALMGWEYTISATIANFKGYRKWRKEFNQELESVLFSTKRINDFDKTMFLDWLDKLPAQARFRVKNRIFNSKNDDDSFKYAKLQSWYIEWEQFKVVKQQEQRVLEEKVRQGQATEEDKALLNTIKKEAKVTTGAITFRELYEQVCQNNVDELKLESFIQNKVNLPYNSLVIIDDSGSMTGDPFNFAMFIAAVCLYKNPDDDARSLIGMFNDFSHWHSCIDKESGPTYNSILRRQVAVDCAPKPFINPELSFIDNYNNIKSFLNAAFRGGMTNISSIPEGLRCACTGHPEILDALKSYPIWTIISDGEWNNLHSPEASMNDFMKKCENWFGFRPFIVAIDIQDTRWFYPTVDRFSGIDNMIYIPANLAQIEMFLTNFRDMETFDVYTPLLSLYRSNRYDLVRNNTL